MKYIKVEFRIVIEETKPSLSYCITTSIMQTLL